MQQINELTRDNEFLKKENQQNQTLIHKIQLIRDENNRLKNENLDLRENQLSTRTLQDQVLFHQKESNHLKEKIRALQADLSNLRIEYTARASIPQREKRPELNEETKVLINHLKETLEANKKDFTLHLEAKKKQDQDVFEMRSQLQRAQDKIAALNQDNMNTAQHSKSLEDEQHILRNQIQGKQQEIVILKNRLDEANKCMNEMSKNMPTQDYENIIIEYRNENKKMRDAYEKERECRKEAEKGLKFEEMLKEAQVNIKKCSDENKRLLEENMGLERQVIEMRNVLIQAEQERAGNQDIFKEISDERDKEYEKMQELTEQIKNLEKQLQGSQNNNKQSESDIGNLQQDNEELQYAIDQLKDEYSHLERDYEKMKSLASEDTTFDLIKDENNQLKFLNDQLKAQIQASQTSQPRNQEVIKQAGKIKELEAALQ